MLTYARAPMDSQTTCSNEQVSCRRIEERARTLAKRSPGASSLPAGADGGRILDPARARSRRNSFLQRSAAKAASHPNSPQASVQPAADLPQGVRAQVTKTVLDNQRLSYTETQVAQTRLTHRPGELARVAGRLGEANINIDYAYVGIEPATNNPLLICGVADVNKAAKILDEAAAAAA
jgi:hypothetical protein